MLKKMALAAGGLTLIASVPAIAFTMGKLEIESPLNQPLRARIAINGAAAAHNLIDDIQVSVPDSAAYRKLGLPRSALLNRLKIKVVANDGQPYLRLTTKQPVSDPALDFLLRIQAKDGASIREFTGFLNPPGYAVISPRVVQTAAENAAASATQQNEKPPLAASVAPAPKPHKQTNAAADNGPSEVSSASAPRSAESGAEQSRRAAPTYGPVQPNETLWSIATKHRPSGGPVGVAQVAAGIYRTNPSAFGDSPNRLYAGATLTIPSADYDQAIDLARAQRLVIGEGATDAARPQAQVAARAAHSTGKLQLTAARDSAADDQPAPVEQSSTSVDSPSASASPGGQDIGGGPVGLSENTMVTLFALAGSVAGTNFKAVPLPAQSNAGAAKPAASNRQAGGSVASTKAANTDHVGDAEGQTETGSSVAAGAASVSKTAQIDTAKTSVSGGSAQKLGGNESQPAKVTGNNAGQKPPVTVTDTSESDSLSARDLYEAGIILGLVALLALLILVWWVKRQNSRSGQQEQVRPATVGPVAAEEHGPATAVATASQDDVQAALADADFSIAYALFDQALSGLQPVLATHPQSQALRVKELEALHGSGDGERFSERADVYAQDFEVNEEDGDWLAIQQMRADLAESAVTTTPQLVAVNDQADIEESHEVSADFSAAATLEDHAATQDTWPREVEETESQAVALAEHAPDSDAGTRNQEIKADQLAGAPEGLGDAGEADEGFIDGSGAEAPYDIPATDAPMRTLEFEEAESQPVASTESVSGGDTGEHNQQSGIEAEEFAGISSPQQADKLQAADQEPESLDTPAAENDAAAESDQRQQAVAEAGEEAAPDSVDFDLTDLPFETVQPATGAGDERDVGLDFPLDDAGPVSASADQASDKSVNSNSVIPFTDSANGVSFDFDEFPGLDSNGNDEPVFGPEADLSTKLDLARAYLDMEDGETASFLLEDVISQGDLWQQEEARQLKQRIA